MTVYRFHSLGVVARHSACARKVWSGCTAQLDYCTNGNGLGELEESVQYELDFLAISLFCQEICPKYRWLQNLKKLHRWKSPWTYCVGEVWRGSVPWKRSYLPLHNRWRAWRASRMSDAKSGCIAGHRGIHQQTTVVWDVGTRWQYLQDIDHWLSKRL